MKDKLEVGMYVRTDLGEIGKITSVASDDVLGTGEMTFYNSEPYLKGNETKASYNIIDLIEVGDYVNGCKVHNIANCLTIILNNEENISWINPSDIKSIVTKEMYSSVEYRVETN